MGLGIEAEVFLIYAAIIFIIYFFGRILIIPLKKAGKMLLRILMGAAVASGIAFIGSGIGITMPVNIITATITGLLGLPGITGLILYFNVVVRLL